MVQLSVVICTYNRSGLLDSCLASLSAQSLDVRAFEVLVVDNDSPDGTAAVIDRWRQETGNVRALRRARPRPVVGSEHRLREAAADIVAFIDDDARPDPGWAAALLDAYERWPGVAAVGGPVSLNWPRPRPRWLTPGLESWFSRLDHGDAPRLLEAPAPLFGTNLSVRRRLALELGGFAVELGRVRQVLLSGEDIEFLGRLRRHGGAVGYEPRALVRHEVAAERLSPWWLVRRAYAQGRTDVLVRRRQGMAADRRTLLRESAGALAAAVLRGWRECARRVAASDNQAAAAMGEAVRRSRRLGDGHQSLALALGRPRSH